MRHYKTNIAGLNARLTFVQNAEQTVDRSPENFAVKLNENGE